MKRLLFILMAALLLAGCGNDSQQKEKLIVEDEVEIEEAKAEIIGEKELNITLLDNEDLKITLLNSVHQRVEDYEVRDTLFLDFEIENKKNRTFNYYIDDDMSIDGRSETYIVGMTETDVGPEEKAIITANISSGSLDDKKLTFEEHISGTLVYRDFEGNRNVVEFSEYINE